MTRLPRRFRKAQTGATAVEFALVGPAFLLLVFMVFEMGLLLATQSLLDAGTVYAARQLEIGNSTATTASGFKNLVCVRASALISSCSSSIQVYATSGNSYSSLQSATVSSNGTMTPSTFSAGAGGADVLVQVVYARPFLSGVISALGGITQSTLMSTAIVQNEPSP